MTDTIPVSFNCKRCGERLSWPDNAVDSTVISCNRCGTKFGTYADLRHTAMDAVRSKAESIIKDAFKSR